MAFILMQRPRILPDYKLLNLLKGFAVISSLILRSASVSSLNSKCPLNLCQGPTPVLDPERSLVESTRQAPVICPTMPCQL